MKKAQTLSLKFLLRLIITALILIFIINFGLRLFRLNDRSYESYNALLSEINDPDFEDGEVRSLALYMDKKTLIAGFDKDTEKIEFIYKSAFSEDPYIGYVSPSKKNLERPTQCAMGTSCIFLCEDVVSFNEESYKCKKIKAINEISFRIGSNNNQCGDNENCISLSKGGFIFLLYPGEVIRPRISTIYIEKQDNTIYVCDSYPCFKE